MSKIQFSSASSVSSFTGALSASGGISNTELLHRQEHHHQQLLDLINKINILNDTQFLPGTIPDQSKKQKLSQHATASLGRTQEHSDDPRCFSHSNVMPLSGQFTLSRRGVLTLHPSRANQQSMSTVHTCLRPMLY